ncbi:hypothetical protein NECAME_11201 [Necator americanus]|uniref:Uncharacterized protein n=1 Tax=Necator americanus TaxID=51031 RepID=W2T5P2_NECAM|nr:hypothetical protein NECAME_11201 [Necator americanus]ETN77223.1 hypothetical protein NECAME_11201 [Necator americanus]
MGLRFFTSILGAPMKSKTFFLFQKDKPTTVYIQMYIEGMSSFRAQTMNERVTRIRSATMKIMLSRGYEK